MPIAGEPLIASGREAVEMLRRNLLKTIGVWWLPPMIVQVGAPGPATPGPCQP